VALTVPDCAEASAAKKGKTAGATATKKKDKRANFAKKAENFFMFR
jgi:hypothetical protein